MRTTIQDIWARTTDCKSGKAVVVFDRADGFYYSLDPISHGDEATDLETTQPLVGPFSRGRMSVVLQFEPRKGQEFGAMWMSDELLRRYLDGKALPLPLSGDERVYTESEVKERR